MSEMWCRCAMNSSLSDLFGQMARPTTIQDRRDAPREIACNLEPRRDVVDRANRGADGRSPDDLALFLFCGRAEAIRQVSHRQPEGERTAGSFDRGWKALTINGKTMPTLFDRPAELEHAIELPEGLCRDEEFVRVDFLLTDSGLRFRGITPYHSAGNNEFTLEWADRYLDSPC